RRCLHQSQPAAAIKVAEQVILDRLLAMIDFLPDAGVVRHQTSPTSAMSSAASSGGSSDRAVRSTECVSQLPGASFSRRLRFLRNAIPTAEVGTMTTRVPLRRGSEAAGT